MLRDLEATKHAGLSDLAWSGHQHGVTLGELRWFIGELERFLSANVKIRDEDERAAPPL